MSQKPHIVIIIPRGEAVRNFLYSDTLQILSENAKITLLSVIHDKRFRQRFESLADIIPLEQYPEKRVTAIIRHIVHMAHFRWLWSGVARNKWEADDYIARTTAQTAKRFLEKRLYQLLAFRPIIEGLTRLENWATLNLRSTNHFHELFRELKPDLVFNGSHIHGTGSRLPIQVAHDLGIPTVGFVFSWDNLTSRSRILEPYDHYIVWTESIKNDLLRIYPYVRSNQVHATGTPQFDFHFKQENWLTREELARLIGFDADRPFIFYTTGIDYHFPEEHRTVDLVISLLKDMPLKPQLVIRNYVKGISAGMQSLMNKEHPDVFFPPMQWNTQWFMPTEDDQKIYTSMLRECAIGINAASTVSLELMIHQKPVINISFDPPDSDLPKHLRWSRHTDEFDHFIPVTKSRAVRVARSEQEIAEFLRRGLDFPEEQTHNQQYFLDKMFSSLLDGRASERIATTLLSVIDN